MGDLISAIFSIFTTHGVSGVGWVISAILIYVLYRLIVLHRKDIKDITEKHQIDVQKIYEDHHTDLMNITNSAIKAINENTAALTVLATRVQDWVLRRISDG